MQRRAHTHTHTDLPDGRGGKATDLSFFSSAAERQFFTVFSSWSSHLSEPQGGTLQWITKRAAMPDAWLTATAHTHTHTHECTHIHIEKRMSKHTHTDRK